MDTVLLLTDIPPTSDYTAGIVLNQLSSFLPEGALGCFCVRAPSLDATVSPDLKGVPVRYAVKPREYWRVGPGPIGDFTSFIGEWYTSRMGLTPLIREIIGFGKEIGARKVWCVLQGQTMIRLALPVAAGLGCPLYTQVWDPPAWWLRDNCVDRLSSQEILSVFDRTLRGSAACGTASIPMAEEYAERYAVPTVPLLPSLDPSAVRPIRVHPGHGDEGFRIGMAGQVYAEREWNALMEALDGSGWRIAEREVSIRHVGRPIDARVEWADRIEECGWQSQDETIRLISETDLAYCPYWFDPAFEEAARLSFPSKLTTYFAAGVPVLFHGPENSSPARFIREHQAGLCCHSVDSGEIVKVIIGLIKSPSINMIIAENGRRAFEECLTTTALRRSFLRFLDISETVPHPQKSDGA
jgi:glycosyltransferase involved in cell wall biosynthesis